MFCYEQTDENITKCTAEFYRYISICSKKIVGSTTAVGDSPTEGPPEGCEGADNPPEGSEPPPETLGNPDDAKSQEVWMDFENFCKCFKYVVVFFRIFIL